jgi:N-acetylglucosaminyl-diphospho-decaprenol L-rhamnosyltransferase
LKLSFIIVEFRDTVALDGAIRSIKANTGVMSCELIVVSNSVYDLTKQSELKCRYPDVRFIFSDKNLGFGKGVNLGIMSASGEYFVIINPDARLIDRSIADALRHMEEHDNVGIMGPLVRDSEGRVQDSARKFLTGLRLVKRVMKRGVNSRGKPVLEEGQHSKVIKVDWVSGACLMVRASAIEKVGLLDERFFMYAEDMDWCKRFGLAGWDVLYYPLWRVEHNASRASSSKLSLGNRLMWIHLASLLKYAVKWTLIDKTGRIEQEADI